MNKDKLIVKVQQFQHFLANIFLVLMIIIVIIIVFKIVWWRNEKDISKTKTDT